MAKRLGDDEIKSDSLYHYRIVQKQQNRVITLNLPFLPTLHTNPAPSPPSFYNVMTEVYKTPNACVKYQVMVCLPACLSPFETLFHHGPAFAPLFKSKPGRANINCKPDFPTRESSVQEFPGPVVLPGYIDKAPQPTCPRPFVVAVRGLKASGFSPTHKSIRGCSIIAPPFFLDNPTRMSSNSGRPFHANAALVQNIQLCMYFIVFSEN
ncbi:hypothetical protein QBC46DRAFT_386591, partial [Diplogelasinospora grovesii]